MRIVMSIHHELDPNQGAPGATCQLVNNYRKLGFATDTISFSSYPPRIKRSKGIWGSALFPWYVCNHLRRSAESYDVADLSSGDGWVYQTLRPSKNILVVTRSHGLEHVRDDLLRKDATESKTSISWKYPLYHGGFRLWEVARSFKNADLSIFLSESDREYAIARFRLAPESTAVVNNGIPDDFLGLASKPPATRTTAPLRIAVIGTYQYRKINVAPAAITRLLGNNKTLEIGFLGTGVEQAVVLRDYSPSHHQRIRVVSTYKHEQLPELLKEYDILLFPSLHEGFPLSVFEAMACGLAVVATNLPTLTTRLTDQQQALFIPTNSRTAIEDAISRLIADRTLLRDLQVRGQQRAQDFAWSRIASDTLSLYADALARKQRKVRP